MAINTYENLTENKGPSLSSSKFSNKNSQLTIKIDYTADDSISNCNSKCEKFKRNANVSPYLTEDRIELLSRITEKRLISKKTTDFISSYPLAVNIYKASSDEFKALKKNKKMKKSVLTLPNEPAPLPEVCTVSDMNESEYCDDKKIKPKKKRTTQNNRKPRISKPMQIFNRDAEYCSRLNIDLDSSSTDMINQFPGDGKKIVKRRTNVARKSDNNAHDVWAMVRKINRFHFQPTPPFSEDSINSLKKRNAINKRRKNQIDTKVIETTTTEEFTYFSNIDDKTVHNSQSSLDCITVIDKQDDYQEFCEEFKANNNKVPKIKNERHYKKGNFNAKSIACSPKDIHSGTVNVEKCHQSNMKLKHRFGKQKKSQRKVQNENDKLMLTYNPCNNSQLECQNSNNKKDKKEFNESDDKVHVFEKSVSSNGDFKSYTGSSLTFEDTSNKISLSESQGEINGITKVVLSKGQKEVEPIKSNVFLKRMAYLGTSINRPTTVLRPKLTQADIKRRLANIKFPLVILAKDQLTSAPFQVTHYEPPQFEGLDKAIWPFMKSWQKQTISSKQDSIQVHDNNTTQILKSDGIEEKNGMKIHKGNNNPVSKDRNVIPAPPTNTVNINIKTPKTKPVQQLKERMLQFLLRKPSNDDYKNCTPKEITKRLDLPDANVATNTSHVMLKNEQKRLIHTDVKKANNISSTTKQPLSKGRWGSEFIDNVIKKIKSGVYYNQEEKYFLKTPCYITREGSVQTEMDIVQYDCPTIVCKKCTQEINPQTKIEEIDETRDQSLAIPGFDDYPSALQVETINKSNVAIKHCVTNIIVQFDIVMPYEVNATLHDKQSVSCVPLSIPESHQKIFKSKTTIVNAFLPAELCSILPNMMRKIIIDNQLPKIFEIGETNLSAKSIIPITNNSIKQCMPAQIDVSPELRILGQGHFPNNISTIITKNSSHKKYIQSSFKKLNTRQQNDILINIHQDLLFTCIINPNAMLFESNQSAEQVSEVNSKRVHQNISSCMELQPYESNKQNAPDLILNNIERVSLKLNDQTFSIQVNILINPFNDTCYKNMLNIMTMGVKTENNNFNCVLSGMSIDSVLNGIHEYLFKGNKMVTNILKPNITDRCSALSQITESENYKSGVEFCIPKISNKKRTFKKSHKKCKSMSNISVEKSNTPLRKIKNLDDFFLALGTAKSLASVIDGSAEKKIMTSINEMKHWINEVTPRQALLILLLANKKDTSNLVRYRPVILQGIAVNRITRASELDMEIEVIEKEKLNIFSPYEGISYLPASVENQDSLFEELYWIAKTTASDYQKPFNDSSERLLRSLLEKRKRLNPSYLRVMARYVGLGLLKSPK